MEERVKHVQESLYLMVLLVLRQQWGEWFHNCVVIWYNVTNVSQRRIKAPVHFSIGWALVTSSVGSVQDLRKGPISGSIPANFYPRTDDSHCKRIYSTLITDHCFGNAYECSLWLGKIDLQCTGKRLLEECIGCCNIFVAFVEDNATMSSIPYFENCVSYSVQNLRK